MITATMFEAKSNLSELVRKAQSGEKVIITTGRDKVPVAEIVALEAAKERPFDLFYNPSFELPEDFDELSPEAETLEWGG